MATKRVVVLPYTEQWATDFETIKQEIESALSGLIIDIEHVGSTSVKGLSAKPCIDIDVVIRDYSVFEAVVARLAAIGYTHQGDLGIAEREAFQYDNKSHLQNHHLYVCPQNSQELHRHITFRNYLRTHPQAVAKYSAVKENAARLYPDDINKYIAYKSPCIEELYSLCGLR